MKFMRETPEFKAYKKDLFLDLIWWQGRQLTIGPTCCCEDTPDIWCLRDDHALAALPESLSMPPCTCRYGLYRVTGAPGPWLWTHRPGIRRPEPLTAAFRIDPACPHHGDRR